MILKVKGLDHAKYNVTFRLVYAISLKFDVLLQYDVRRILQKFDLFMIAMFENNF